MISDSGSGQQGTSSAVLDPTMSLVGRLEDLSLGEILQIVSLSKRSGLLRLESPGGKASLYIRAGKVIFASSSDERKGVLGLLAESGLISEDHLDHFNQILDTVPSQEAFRDLLREDAGCSHQQVQEVLRRRVEELTYALFNWEEGTFSFQLIDNEMRHPHLARVAPFFLDDGIGAQFLVMEGARRKDEMLRDAALPSDSGRSPMVDPGTVLGDDWEQEFEQQLAGPQEEKGAPLADSGLEEEIEEFAVPAALPKIPDGLAATVVAIGLQAHLVVEITGGLVRAGVEFIPFDNGADALTKIQELRQRGSSPYLLLDLEASGITDGRHYGGLEIISTMWDFGFHLPVGLVCRTDIREELLARLQAVEGLTVFSSGPSHESSSPGEILERITTLMDTSAVLAHPEEQDPSSPDTGQERVEEGPPQALPEGGEEEIPGSEDPAGKDEEYYDIEQEFSQELSDIDLPVDDWDRAPPGLQEVSLDPHMARLGSYVSELNRQDISGEITLLALRFASAFTNRAILFLVRKDDLKGLGQFGVELERGLDADSVVRSLNIPLEPGSLFARVAEHRQSYKGPPTGTASEKALFDALGGGVPGQVYVGPVVSMGKVAVLLYGDDFPVCGGLEPTHTLDIFLSHVGLALDRAFLEMKLKSQRS